MTKKIYKNIYVVKEPPIWQNFKFCRNTLQLEVFQNNLTFCLQNLRVGEMIFLEFLDLRAIPSMSLTGFKVLSTGFQILLTEFQIFLTELQIHTKCGLQNNTLGLINRIWISIEKISNPSKPMKHNYWKFSQHNIRLEVLLTEFEILSDLKFCHNIYFTTHMWNSSFQEMDKVMFEYLNCIHGNSFGKHCSFYFHIVIIWTVL